MKVYQLRELDRLSRAYDLANLNRLLKQTKGKRYAIKSKDDLFDFERIEQDIIESEESIKRKRTKDIMLERDRRMQEYYAKREERSKDK